tara:strand:+ start:387 stop:518 length:132 start_codon:yes stop_codon:yes gene_type:complete
LLREKLKIQDLKELGSLEKKNNSYDKEQTIALINLRSCKYPKE